MKMTFRARPEFSLRTLLQACSRTSPSVFYAQMPMLGKQAWLWLEAWVAEHSCFTQHNSRTMAELQHRTPTVLKGRIQAKLGQSTTAGTNKVLDLAATRFTGHLCSLLLQRDEGFLHPYKPLQNQQEWVVALFMELCKSSPSCSDIDSDLVRKKVSK
jgi:hypothetical protein